LVVYASVLGTYSTALCLPHQHQSVPLLLPVLVLLVFWLPILFLISKILQLGEAKLQDGVYW
jgi:hypothetical protein